ncbi:MAG TPA: M23 family metallopeptidase [Polyangiaceae bacterium]
MAAVGACCVVVSACGARSSEGAARDPHGETPPSGAPRVSVPPPERPPGPPQWSYVLPLDFGIRSDAAGEGAFRARRTHGEHNGLDLLAPLGTPVLAACAGEARSGTTGAFGNWVQLVCPLPAAFGGSGAGSVSLFYAHLLDAEVADSWTSVPRARVLGRVGKTGNAAGPSVEPHLHLEVVIADDERAARDETHSGLIQSSSWAVATFLSRLARTCLDPHTFAPGSGQVQRARRVDPFLVFTCFAVEKPALATPEGRLAAASVKWSQRYTSQDFDVDQGLSRFSAPARAPRATLEYFTGRWQGEYLGTQAFAALEVSAGGRFDVQVQTGPERACQLGGQLHIEAPRLHFETPDSECAGAEAHFGWTYLVDATTDEFSVADPTLPGAVTREAGELRGPVWRFERQTVSAGP